MYALKNSRILLPIAGLLTLTGVGIVAAKAQPPSPPTTPTPPAGALARPGRGARMGHERHPEMMKALRNLEQAKHDLEHSAHDFNGHRAKALDLTEKAIQEVKEALKSDRN